MQSEYREAAEGGSAADLVEVVVGREQVVALFDSVWARAVPLPTGRAETKGELDERSRQILLLMSGGLKDESIARALGTSRVPCRPAFQRS